jgi:hypothetical protein
MRKERRPICASGLSGANKGSGLSDRECDSIARTAWRPSLRKERRTLAHAGRAAAYLGGSGLLLLGR